MSAQIRQDIEVACSNGLQYVAAYCIVLQYASAHQPVYPGSVFRWVGIGCRVLQHIAVCESHCSQHIQVECSNELRAAMCCSVLHRVAVCARTCVSVSRPTFHLRPPSLPHAHTLTVSLHTNTTCSHLLVTRRLIELPCHPRQRLLRPLTLTLQSGM